MRSSAGGLRRFRDELRMREYMQGVREWSGLVLSGKDGSGGGPECHMTLRNGKHVKKTISEVFPTSS